MRQYRYFISYAAWSPNGVPRFGNTELRRQAPITGHADITGIGDDLARDLGIPKAIVLNWQQFPDVGTERL